MSHTIIRARRRHRFVILDQRAVEDARLTWAARGLLGYLLSRPDDWKVLIKDLQRRGNLGRDGIYALLKELRATDYVRFERARDQRGRMRGGTYYVQEIPDAPDPDLPDTVGPDTASPDTVKPEALPNTELNLRTTTTTTSTTNGSRCRGTEPTDFEVPPCLPAELQASAERLVAGLDQRLAQQVMDEWAGIIAAGVIRSSAIGCLRGLIKRAHEGTFTPERALCVHEVREARKRAVAAAEQDPRLRSLRG
jgi:hypothetical protein